MKYKSIRENHHLKNLYKSSSSKHLIAVLKNQRTVLLNLVQLLFCLPQKEFSAAEISTVTLNMIP